MTFHSEQNRPPLLPRVVLAVAGLMVASCSGGGSPESASTSTSTALNPESVQPSIVPGPHLELEVVGTTTFRDYRTALDPGRVVPKGVEVTADCTETGPAGVGLVSLIGSKNNGKWYKLVAPEKYIGWYASAGTFQNGTPDGGAAVDATLREC